MWEDDEETIAWQKNRRNHIGRGQWGIIKVQLEMKAAHVSLKKSEWLLLQRFVAKHEEHPYKVSVEDYKHLPKKVQRVIEDWLHHISRTSVEPK